MKIPPSRNAYIAEKRQNIGDGDSLCDRTCYDSLANLLTSYETGKTSNPDPRIVEYFTKYPEPTHVCIFEKLQGCATFLDNFNF